ncbi:hypothetical protein [Neobacillus sp. K501]
MPQVWELERGPWDFEDLTMNKDKNKLVFAMNEGGNSKGFLVNLERSTLFTWDTPMGVITNLRFSPDHQKLAYVLNCPTNPSDIWELDLKTRVASHKTSPVITSTSTKP